MTMPFVYHMTHALAAILPMYPCGIDFYLKGVMILRFNVIKPLVVLVGSTGFGVDGTGASSPSQSTLAGQSQVPYLGLA